jgi:lipopolysaccharide transport system permease protein
MTESITIIDANGGSSLRLFHEVWQYRELFYVFSWRDVKIKYKQTMLGVVWVLFQPIVTVGIFTVFFGKIAKIPSDGIPYPLFVLVGLVVWNFFSASLSTGSQSLIANEGILKKVYFPRVILPISAVLTNSIDYFLSMIFAILAFLVTGFGLRIELIPVIIISTIVVLLSSSGLALGLSSINVKYRDVRYILPFFIQIGLFVTPIIYPVSVIYDYRRYFLLLNPLTGPIEALRASFSGVGHVDYLLLFSSLIVSLIIFTFGFLVFRKTEKFFADIA